MIEQAQKAGFELIDAFSPDGSVVLLENSDRARVWDLRRGRQVAALEPGTYGGGGAFAPGNRLLYTASQIEDIGLKGRDFMGDVRDILREPGPAVVPSLLAVDLAAIRAELGLEAPDEVLERLRPRCADAARQ